MNRVLRTFVLWPAIILAMVIIPTVALSGGFTWTAYAAPVQNLNFASPITTPGSTVPYPTPRPPRHHPHHPFPTATPYIPPTPTMTPTATATETAVAPEGVQANGHPLKKVIGDTLSNVIYGYTTDGELYRSSDDGATWNLVTSSPQVDDFIMNAANPNVLYSGKGADCTKESTTKEPMYKSVNGGLTWTALPNSDNKRPFLSHQADPNSLFAADCKVPYVTTDGGQTWTARPDSTSDALWDNYHVVDMVAASLLGNPTPDKPNWDQIFVGGVSKDGSGVVVFTNDQGKTWVRLTPNVNPASWGMTAMMADPFIEGLVGFTEPKGVWMTENYGVNWKFSADGLDDVVKPGTDGTTGINDLVHTNNDELYLATVRGLYTKGMADKSWTKVAGVAFEDMTITNLLFTESNSGTLWLNTTDGVFTYPIQ